MDPDLFLIFGFIIVVTAIVMGTKGTAVASEIEALRLGDSRRDIQTPLAMAQRAGEKVL